MSNNPNKPVISSESGHGTIASEHAWVSGNFTPFQVISGHDDPLVVVGGIVVDSEIPQQFHALVVVLLINVGTGSDVVIVEKLKKFDKNGQINQYFFTAKQNTCFFFNPNKPCIILTFSIWK